MKDPSPELIGPAELRERLGISEATYYRWLKSGRLQGVRVGRRWRFPASTIDELLGSDATGNARTRALRAAVNQCSDWLKLSDSGREEVRQMVAEGQAAHAVIDMLLERAIHDRATSIHLAPVADGLAVRERIHGIMHPSDEVLPEEARDDIVSAIKLRAGMAATVDNLPQDARFFATIDGRKIDVHCSLFPTALGESFTLRLLDPAAVNLSFTSTGFREGPADRIRDIVRAPKGVFLVNGPSGSGKTTTIYSLLTELNEPGTKIMTIEDPVEFHIDGILQAPLVERMTFRGAMLSMLRSDVDVGYVAELRDADTMQLLFQMAATGHKMLSTLHADDPASALRRLLEVGELSPRMIVDQLLGVLDQRLIPRACPACRTRRPMTTAEAEALGLAGRADDYEVADAGDQPDCEKCGGRGICGRTAVGELWTITPTVRSAIESGKLDNLRAAARRDGIETMRDDVIARLAAGEVLPKHAIAVLGRDRAAGG